MESPLDDFPTEPTARSNAPTSHVPQFAPIVESSTRRRRSRKRRHRSLAALTAPFRVVGAAGRFASRKSLEWTKRIGLLLRRLPTAFERTWHTVATWIGLRPQSSTKNLADEILDIAHDAGLTPGAAASLQRVVAESIEREAERLTTHDHEGTPPRLLAIAVATALFVGVVYGIIWQRPWIAARIAPAKTSNVVDAAAPPPRETPVASAAAASVVVTEPAKAKSRSPVITAPPVPVAHPGQLRIVTEPPGARVTVNGVGRGVTPVTIQHLPPGAKRVRVTKDGYAGVERVVSLAESGPAQIVRIPMERRE